MDTRISGHETALFAAVRDGNEKLVAELLQRRASVNVEAFEGNTPLLQAAALGRNFFLSAAPA